MITDSGVICTSSEGHPDGTLISDRVRYEIPFGPLGVLAHAAFVRHDLERVFDHRQDAVPRLLANLAL